MPPEREILAAFGGIRDLRRLVPAEFLERFDLVAPMQYGIVCQDVRLGIDRLEALGAGPFLYAETRPPGWTERGERKSVRAQMALGYLDHQQVELIGPGENTHFYDEKIPSDGSFALHHVGIAQLGMNRVKAALTAAGFDSVVEIGMRIGPLYSVDVAYFDTRDELGFYLEILEFKSFGRHAPLLEGLISRIGRLQRLLRGSRPSGKDI
jgi:hypothetical protein